MTSFEALDVDETVEPEIAPVPVAFPVKLTVPADPAAYVHVNVALPPAAMLADAGDGPVEYVAVLVPPIVKVDGATPFAVVPPSLFTVITTVTVWPGVTVAGVATMDDVSAAVASIVTSFEALDVDEIELPEVAPVPWRCQ